MALSQIFMNDRGPRAGWRLVIWLVIVVGITLLLQFALSFLPNAGDHPFLDPRWMLTDDMALLLAALAATLVMASAEHLTLGDYYIPRWRLFNKQFCHGLLWGFLAVSLLMGLIALLRGYRINGLAIGGSAFVRAALWWLAAALGIGIAEEIAFRGYMLRTLADGIRFWPAAILLSVGFGSLHYFAKPFERWEDFASTTLLGLFGCLTIRRTGSLAFIIGFHVAFDWAALFFYSGRNAGEFAIGHLFQTSWNRSDWLTGGLLGPEASWFVFPVIALLFWVFSRFYPSPRTRA